MHRSILGQIFFVSNKIKSRAISVKYLPIFVFIVLYKVFSAVWKYEYILLGDEYSNNEKENSARKCIIKYFVFSWLV